MLALAEQLPHQACRPQEGVVCRGGCGKPAKTHWRWKVPMCQTCQSACALWHRTH